MIMKKHIIILLSTLSLFLAGCGGFVREELVQMQQEIDDLRSQIEPLNNSIKSVHEVATEMANGGFVTSISEISEESRTGYELTFNNGKTIKLLSGITGKDGKDGKTPQIGMLQDSDGIYYWTLDGQWLENGSGEKVRAAEKGGIVPAFKIEDGKILLSVDKENTWNEVGVAHGAEAVSIVSYADITSFKDRIVLTLSDGSKLEVPRYQPIKVTLNLSGEDNSISAGETLPVKYTLEGNISENTLVTAGTDGKYKTRIERLSDSEGIVHVTCPNIYSDGYIYVMVNDGEGHSSVKVITFFKRIMNVNDGLSFDVDCVGGSIEIPWSANFEYNLVAADGAESWIHVLGTRAEMASGTIRLQIDANPLDEVRTGILEIRPKDNPDYVYERIIITEASAYFTIDNSHITVPSAGGKYESHITSSRGLSIDFPEDASEWLSYNLEQTSEYSYTLSVSAEKNRTDDRRNATITIKTGDREYEQGRVSVVQLPEVIDHQRDFVLTVRANEIFDWTVYLPLSRRMDCYIDWGDGNVELFENDDNREKEYPSHKYDVTSATTFTVSVSGSVQEINSIKDGNGMPNRGAIISIEQWGDLDIQEFQHAFEGCSQLVSMPDDELGFFADVHDFTESFKQCVSLKSIPGGLFRYASKANVFRGTFRETAIETIPGTLFANCDPRAIFEETFCYCKNLRSIPGDLFSNSTETERFNSIFQNCVNLESIPANLFSNCLKVRSFQSAFFECHSLKSIPEGLFRNCPEVVTFEGTFHGCKALRTIPAKLFDSNRKVENFRDCFVECDNLSGETPYTMIGNVKVHLYERFDYPDYFVTPIYYNVCFPGHQLFTDAERISEGW